MKKIVILLLISLTTYSVSAQVTWNVKGGVGLASCLMEEVNNAKSKFVGKIGLGIEMPFASDWSLMPSLEMAWKGAAWENYTKETLNESYLQIPVLVAYRLNLNPHWNVTLKVGPYFAWLLSAKDKIEYMGETSEYDLIDFDANRLDIGLDAGVDFEYHRFVFGLEYEIGFMSMHPDIEIKNSAFYLTAGYKF